MNRDRSCSPSEGRYPKSRWSIFGSGKLRPVSFAYTRCHSQRNSRFPSELRGTGFRRVASPKIYCRRALFFIFCHRKEQRTDPTPLFNVSQSQSPGCTIVQECQPPAVPTVSRRSKQETTLFSQVFRWVTADFIAHFCKNRRRACVRFLGAEPPVRLLRTGG